LSPLNAIEAAGLGKSFGGRAACTGVSFEVRRGEVFGLLGPNGAGKTTTLRMLAGLYAPDEGSATVAGFSIQPGKPGGPALRAKVGLLTESPGFYDRLTARENLLYFGRLQNASDAQTQKLLDRFALAPHADRPFAELSRGMKQKLAIARALLHEPEVIFLDEPTVGLDPEATREVRSVIAELAAEHATIVLCTHHLDEVERLCSRAAFIAGRLLAVHEIRQKPLVKIEFAEPFEGETQLVFEPQKPIYELVGELVRRGAKIEAVYPHKDPLEEAWLQLLAEARERGLTA
jgi:ABC-2 type transport system ATP-binding protein